jgi:hypothetical protein
MRQMFIKASKLLALLLLVMATPLIAQKKSVTGQDTQVSITLRNTEDRQRANEIVSVDFGLLSSKIKDLQNFRVTEAKTGRELVFQLEYRGMDRPQNLLVQVTLPADGEITLYVQEGRPSAFIPRTFARYVPERKDDFAWENNLVGFRMYGKALESTNENAYGIDVWTKRTDKLIVDKWYKEGDYHTDHGEGLDYYGVGFTLGAGDIAPYFDSIYFSKNYYKHQVLDNGPLRSTFRLFYHAWEADGVTVTATKEISLDADSQLNRFAVKYEIAGSDVIPAVIGIVKRKGPGDVFFSEGRGIMGYWEPEIKESGNTGVGCILTGDADEMIISNGHLLARITIRNDEPIVYYAGACWNRAGRITSSEEWFSYLSSYASKLKHPVGVTVK